MSTATGEASGFDAESATSMTQDFLKRLGYKGNWLPMKVSLDGELYVVEMIFQKLSAKVQINSKTKEIKEYEFQKNEEESKSILNSRIVIFLVVAGALAVVALKFLGVF
ncbi:MAG TPA: hypothetical protein VK536_00980 [Candidatus Limnocylindrales bacterium]|nr:hypothetical protein [Candidatus Limnocylindrales bacterium]